MIIIAGSLSFDPSDRDDVLASLAQVTEASRRDAGCLEYFWAEDLEAPNTFASSSAGSHRSCSTHISARPHEVAFGERNLSRITGATASFFDASPTAPICLRPADGDVVEPVSLRGEEAGGAFRWARSPHSCAPPAGGRGPPSRGGSPAPGSRRLHRAAWRSGCRRSGAPGRRRDPRRSCHRGTRRSSGPARRPGPGAGPPPCAAVRCTRPAGPGCPAATARPSGCSPVLWQGLVSKTIRAPPAVAICTAFSNWLFT